MGFSGQEYWSGLPFPSPVELPDAGIESTSSALAEGFFTSEHLGSPENRAMLFKHLIVICTVPVVPVGQRIWGAYNLYTLESWCGKRCIAICLRKYSVDLGFMLIHSHLPSLLRSLGSSLFLYLLPIYQHGCIPNNASTQNHLQMMFHHKSTSLFFFPV